MNLFYCRCWIGRIVCSGYVTLRCTVLTALYSTSCTVHPFFPSPLLSLIFYRHSLYLTFNLSYSLTDIIHLYDCLPIIKYAHLQVASSFTRSHYLLFSSFWTHKLSLNTSQTPHFSFLSISMLHTSLHPFLFRTPSFLLLTCHSSCYHSCCSCAS